MNYKRKTKSINQTLLKFKTFFLQDIVKKMKRQITD